MMKSLLEHAIAALGFTLLAMLFNVALAVGDTEAYGDAVFVYMMTSWQRFLIINIAFGVLGSFLIFFFELFKRQKTV